MLKKFSEELKEKRELKGISIEQLAAKSRIDIKYLKLMENGNFSFLPEVYVKAFLRDYAKMVGLDHNIILKKFDAAQKGLTYDEKGETGPEENIDAQQGKSENNNDKAKAESVHSYVEPGVSGASASTPSKLNNNMITIGVVAAAVVVIFSLIYFFFLKGGNEIVVEEKPLNQVIQENQKRYEEKTSGPASQNETVNSTDSLQLLIKTSDTCWVRIFLDDSIVDEYTFFPNSQKTLRADRNFKLIIGNSAAIQFELDNKPLSYSGKRGAVSYVQIDSNGIKNLPVQPELNIPQ